MFKATAEHMEELLRAKEICESIIDEIADDDYGYLFNRARLNNAYAEINFVLGDFYAKIKALTP